MKKEARLYEVDGLKLPSVTTVIDVFAKPGLQAWKEGMIRTTTIDAAVTAYAALKKEKKWISQADFKSSVGGLADPKKMWAKNKEAIDIGTIVHKRVEAEMRKELGEDVAIPEINEELIDPHGKVKVNPSWTAYQAYLAWRQTNEVRPLAVEKLLVNRNRGYAGTADFEGYVGDKYTLADWKTSKAVFAEYLLQIAAYRAARYSMGPVPGVLNGLVVRFPKEPDDSFEAVDVPFTDQADLFAVFMGAKRAWDFYNPGKAVYE